MERHQEQLNQRLIKRVPARSSIFFNIKLLNSLNENGGKDYPVLEKGKPYKVTLKMNLDSNLIEKKELNNIKSNCKEIKIIQEKLFSNTVDLK